MKIHRQLLEVRTCQALVDEVLGKVDQAEREDEFQQALLTD